MGKRTRQYLSHFLREVGFKTVLSFVDAGLIDRFGYVFVLNWGEKLLNSKTPYAKMAPKTKLPHIISQISRAVGYLVGGFVWTTVPNKLTNTKRTVISTPSLPGTTSGGMRKLIQETVTNKKLGR